MMQIFEIILTKIWQKDLECCIHFLKLNGYFIHFKTWDAILFQINKDLEEISSELAIGLCEWIINHLELNTIISKTINLNLHGGMAYYALMMKQLMVEIDCKDIFDVSDLLNPDWTRWREFLSAFLHCVNFAEITYQNEQELRDLEEGKNRALFQYERTYASYNSLIDSNEEFELDEKEIVLKEEIPQLNSEFEILSRDKRVKEEELQEIESTLSNLSQLSIELKRELDQWRVQIVRSPEKIKQTQEKIKNDCEVVTKRSQELKRQREYQLTNMSDLYTVLNSIEQITKDENKVRELRADIQDKKTDISKEHEQNAYKNDNIKNLIDHIQLMKDNTSNAKKSFELMKANYDKTFKDIYSENDREEANAKIYLNEVRELELLVKDKIKDIESISKQENEFDEKCVANADILLDQIQRHMAIFKRQIDTYSQFLK